MALQGFLFYMQLAGRFNAPTIQLNAAYLGSAN
jgi:hypothetical protein